MEGSRNEKAAITVVSYILGFTAAYILFGNFSSTATSSVAIPVANNTASVIEATLPAAEIVAPVEAEVEESEDLAVTYQDGKLEVSIKGAVRLLSFNSEESGLTSDEEITQGSHLGKISYAVSKDDKFVFFCEQYESDSETCAGYVYDIDADKIFPVTKAGQVAKISLGSAEDALFTAVGLKIGSNYSANPNAPWVVIGEEEALDLQ